MLAIELKNLSKNFKGKKVVDNLNFSLKQGELLALLGENGAGKSTTINMLCGLTKPTSGDAYILGKSVVNDVFEVKKLINVSPQEIALGNKISIKENLELVARIYGDNKIEAEKKSRVMLEKLKLTEKANEKVKTLSGGMQRKLSIGMALISEPKVLFLDEPTVGLDVRTRNELWRTIEKLKGKVTIILTTHYLEEAQALADKIIIINKGRIKSEGVASKIIEDAGAKNFEEAFLKLTEKEVL